MKIHNRNSFYRYLSFEGAFNTLESRNLRLRSPRLFNDPFDIQAHLIPPIPAEDMMALLSQKIARSVMTGEPFPGSQHLTSEQRLHLDKAARERYSESELRALLNHPHPSLQSEWDEISRRSNEQIQQGLDDLFILCLSTRFDDILMWAHYTAGHTGAVLEFRCIEGVDNIFCAARPVVYQDQFPTFGSEQDWRDYIFEGKPMDTASIFFPLTLTKSSHWKYEDEWRIVVPFHEHRGKDYVTTGLNPVEVANVYLGCKMTNENCAKILKVVSDKYPTTTVFQAQKHDRRFALDFKEIHRALIR